jgi:hypothetical protein
LASITFKAIGNAEEAQLSSQLVVVCGVLLVDALESVDLLLCLVELLRVLRCSLMHSGGKPIGCGMDGGTEHWVEGNECLSRCRGDWRVFSSDEVNKPCEGAQVIGHPLLLMLSDKGA